MTDQPTPLRELVGEQVRRLRVARDWDQQGLADALGMIGWKVDRSAVAKIENATRNVTLEDALALAAVLGVEPVALIVPRDDNATVEVASELQADAAAVRGWFHGVTPLGTTDFRTYEESISDREWRARQRPIVRKLRIAAHVAEQVVGRADFEWLIPDDVVTADRRTANERLREILQGVIAEAQREIDAITQEGT